MAWLIVLAAVVAGCPAKTLRYPAEHERLIRLDHALESLRNAYQQKDRSGFRSMLLPLDQSDDLQRLAEMDFEAFSAIALEFKKFFMDEWTGQPDPAELAAMRRFITFTAETALQLLR